MVPNVSLPLSSDPTTTALPVTTTSNTISAAQQQSQAIQQTVQNIFALNDSSAVVHIFFKEKKKYSEKFLKLELIFIFFFALDWM